MAPYLSKEQTKEAASLEYGKEPGRLMKDRLPAFEALLCSRGLKTKEEQERFLYPRLEDLHDPMKLMDMDRAVKRILLAKNKGEGVLIYGDYDADGITSTALLKQYLTGLGMKVQTYIPNRLSEGYGMSQTVIDGYLDGDVGLIVTVDTGSTAAREIAYAAEHGIETVVIDHHECVGEL
ncbi:MAG: DHH family phosphoesterase, partial [Clostridia bacterium]|nr:DHH family phosphoesterase [Clostridia bacterium]